MNQMKRTKVHAFCVCMFVLCYMFLPLRLNKQNQHNKQFKTDGAMGYNSQNASYKNRERDAPAMLFDIL